MPNWKICLRHGETMRIEYDHSLVADCPMCSLGQPRMTEEVPIDVSIGCAGKPAAAHCPQCHHLEIHHDKNSGVCETCIELGKSGHLKTYSCTGNYFAVPSPFPPSNADSPDLTAQLQASLAAVDAKKGWTRERLLRESAEHFDQCLDLLKRRNTEYAKPDDPFANFKRLGLLSLIQEMDNVVCRMYGYADALYRGVKPAMSEEQITDCEKDLPNFAVLFRGKRLELEGK